MFLLPSLLSISLRNSNILLSFPGTDLSGIDFFHFRNMAGVTSKADSAYLSRLSKNVKPDLGPNCLKGLSVMTMSCKGLTQR